MKKQQSAVTIPSLTLVACLFSSMTVNAADLPRDPSTVIAAVGDRIYSIGETTGKVEEMVAAEMDAAAEIRRYIASGSTTGLLAQAQGKNSPLASAAYMGYPNVVAALLSSDTVKSHINDADEIGMTPWIASTLSLRQSIAECNPRIAENPFALVPVLVAQPYYMSKSMAPYQKTRELLEQAGALVDLNNAKKVWFSLCNNESADGKEKVRKSTDLQTTLQELGLAELGLQLQNLQMKTRSQQGK